MTNKKTETFCFDDGDDHYEIVANKLTYVQMLQLNRLKALSETDQALEMFSLVKSLIVSATCNGSAVDFESDVADCYPDVVRAITEELFKSFVQKKTTVSKI
jgi:hypothetical protein